MMSQEKQMIDSLSVMGLGYRKIVNRIDILGLIGVIVDSTTVGLRDSERAMGYGEPWVEKE